MAVPGLSLSFPQPPADGALDVGGSVLRTEAQLLRLHASAALLGHVTLALLSGRKASVCLRCDSSSPHSFT